MGEPRSLPFEQARMAGRALSDYPGDIPADMATALMLALPGFVERAESLVLAGGKIQTLKTRKPRA